MVGVHDVVFCFAVVMSVTAFDSVVSCPVTLFRVTLIGYSPGTFGATKIRLYFPGVVGSWINFSIVPLISILTSDSHGVAVIVAWIVEPASTVVPSVKVIPRNEGREVLYVKFTIDDVAVTAFDAL